MKKIGIILMLAGAVLVVWGLTRHEPDDGQAEPAMTIEEKMRQVKPEEDSGAAEPEDGAADTDAFALRGDLFDVTGSKIIYGIETRGAATGEAAAGYADGTYRLVATFENLPDPADGRRHFYEGWVVRRGDVLSVISTGEALKEDGAYVNRYLSSTDLTDHDFYVLTLEPRDGNPAPDRHILEGTMTPVN